MDESDASSSLAAKPPSSGAALLTAAGIAAAFGLASCCALPFFLSILGVGTAWLTGVALMVAPHRLLLMTVAATCLLGGAVLLWRQQHATMVCTTKGVCAPPAMRALTLIGLAIGAALLWAGYTYA